MAVAHSRHIRSAILIASAALLVPLVLTLSELHSGGPRAWIRLGALVIIAAALALLLGRQRAFERRALEQEAVERALRESEAKFSGILSIAADAIITVDQSQRIVSFNRGAEAIFGYTGSDVLGRHLAMLIPARYREAHDGHMERFARAPETARRMGERREIFGLRADGSEFPAEASISKLVAPDGILFTVVLRDITDRKRAEEDERFMAETSAALAASLDFDEVAQAIADLSVPRLADAAFVDLIGPGGALRRVIGRRERQELTPALTDLGRVLLDDDSPSPVVDVIRRRRTEHVPIVDQAWLESSEEPRAADAWRRLGAHELLILPLTASDERLGALTLVIVDTRRSFTPEQRALATKFASAAATTLENARLYGLAQRANRARDEVLGVVSHDLRNPISAISMCARALDESPPDDASERHELIATIRESAAWTNRLIQDLLDVTSIEQGHLSLERRPTEAAQLVLQARHMFEMEAEQHGIALRQDVPTNLPLVDADGTRVVQVLGNLVRNAIKFTPRGGSVVLGVTPEDGHVVFFVRDTGAGIPYDAQARVFDRYWQSSNGARSRGTGLGLSIARGIVDAHGGRIWLDSTPGQGTTFFFSLPSTGADGD
jgi:PAS domain S-box-containing protein